MGLAFSGGFISDNGLGYSEGLMTALVLIAVDRHLDGKRRQAFAVGFLAALDRPEIWLFWGPYGLWLWWKDPGARKLVAALFVLHPGASGSCPSTGARATSSAASTAPSIRAPTVPRSPSARSAPSSPTTLGRTVLLRIKIFTALAVGAAGVLLWRGHRIRGSWRLSAVREHALAGIILAGVLGAAWWVVIGIMTQAGFSGNNRYLVLGAALIEIAGGVGWGWLALELGARCCPASYPRCAAPRTGPCRRCAGLRSRSSRPCSCCCPTGSATT